MHAPLIARGFDSRHLHNSEFEERLTSPAPKARARADVSAKSRQGILKSAKSIPAATRRFEPMSARKSFIPQLEKLILRASRLCKCLRLVAKLTSRNWVALLDEVGDVRAVAIDTCRLPWVQLFGFLRFCKRGFHFRLRVAPIAFVPINFGKSNAK